jgi:stage II sporulation protein D
MVNKTKKALSMFVAFLLAISSLAALETLFPITAMAATNPAADADASTLRVKISFDDHTEIPVIIDGVYSILEKQELGALARGNYTAKNISGKMALINDSGKTVASGLATITLKRHKAPDGTNNTIRLTNDYSGTRNYLGDMKFWPNGSYIRVVNHIFLEQYLYGVVAYEMSNSFPLEALKAQAVAARGYAAKRLESARGANYDIGDTSSDQVYKGFNPEYTQVIAAVDATRGMVMRYSDAIIISYFAASNGGQTDRTENVWSSALPYFQLQDDQYDIDNPSSLQRSILFPAGLQADDPQQPYLSAGYTGAQIDSRLKDYLKKAAARDAGALNDLPDATKTYSLNTGPAEASQPEDIIIKAIASMKAVSPKCKHLEHAAAECPSKAFLGLEIRFIAKIKVQDKTTGEVSYEDVLVERTLEKGNSIDITQSFKSSANPAWMVFDPANSLRIFACEEVRDANGNLTAYQLVNRRYGHGIGMSQRGAQQRAKSADAAVNTYQSMLAFYYPGSTLSDLTLTETPLTDPPSLPPAPAGTEYVIVTNCNTSINMRSGPGTSYAVIGILPKGAVLEVVGKGTSWYQVKYNNVAGYAYTQYLAPYTPPPAPTPTPPTPAPSETPTPVPTDSVPPVPSESAAPPTDSGTPAPAETATPTPAPTPTPVPTATPTPTPAPTPVSKLAPVCLGGVNAKSIPVYQSANTSSKKLATLSRGTKFWVLEKGGTWVRMRIGENDWAGYVQTKYCYFYSKTATVNASNLNIRKGAGTGYAVLTKVPKGKKLEVTGYTPTWCKVKYGDIQGYAATSYLRFTRIVGTTSSVGASSSAATMKIIAKELYLRAAASASAKVLATMKNGESVQLLSKGTTWNKVKYNGKTGYAAARYMQ